MKFHLILFSFLIVFTISNVFGEPILFDQNFKAEEFITGLNFPVQMDFVGEDLLVLEKNNGNVRLIRDGMLQEEPVLHVDVVNLGSNGLLGITHVEDNVFLYMTQETDYPDEPLVNRIYKYKWNGEKLVDPILVNELPGNSLGGHVGGGITTDLEGNVYAIIGDLFREGLLQHFDVGEPDDSSVVLRVGLDESVTRPYLTENPYDHYYGIGIRNSFGLAIDPVTGYLWQTENGPENFDEINLIRPGFDGGWKSVHGPATEEQIQNLKKIEGYTYSNPEFSWETVVSPTGLIFMDSKQFREYHDKLFVADFNTGSIFKFMLNDQRNNFIFTNPQLKDLVANPGDSIREMMFGTGFGAIADIQQGPDGLLYLISLDKGGIIYRVAPNERTGSELSPKKIQDSGVDIEEVHCGDGLILILKKSNGIAYCLKPKSTIKLIERDWAIPLIDPENTCNNPPYQGVNWTRCNFSFADMSGVNLENSNLFETNLVGANFIDSNLAKSDLSESNLAFMNFNNANLSNAKLVKAKSYHSDYSNVTMIDADLSRAIFSYSTFTHSDLAGANFSSANLLEAKFFNADLSGADLSNANLELVKFKNTDLSEANFFNANLEYAIFENVILNNTNIRDCKINPLCDDIIPSIEIINSSPDEVINHVGIIVIEGTASDESGIDRVEAFAHTLPRNGESNYVPASPISTGDWSEWSIEITIPDEQSYRVLARVTDKVGNQNWTDIIINSEPEN